MLLPAVSDIEMQVMYNNDDFPAMHSSVVDYQCATFRFSVVMLLT